MAHGGGTWLTQNKSLPGSYINFTSLAKASATLSNRGIAAAPFELDWGPENTVFEVTSGDFHKNSKTLFGYSYDAPEMLAVREIFKHATKVLCYRLGTGGVKASCALGTARYPGKRGNDISIVVTANVDNDDLFDVSTYVGGVFFERQTVADASNLEDNEFVVFNKAANLDDTAGMNFENGANGTVSGESHQSFLDKIESYSFNALCCPANEAQTIGLYVSFTKRMRDEQGAKFQLVAYKPTNADYEGVIGVWNDAEHPTIEGVAPQMLTYWVTGAQAGVAVNKSLTNAIYDGELTIDVDYTQTELEDALAAGKFIFHNVNGKVRVLEDINSLVTLTDEKGNIFQSNQTIRVCDQIANDVAVLFSTRYVGVVPNDASGRATLWNDIVKLIQELERIRAVEDFDADTVHVEVGDNKRAVLLTINGLNIINAMSQLYMSVIIQ
jgi:hypothetical protein